MGSFVYTSSDMPSSINVSDTYMTTSIDQESTTDMTPKLTGNFNSVPMATSSKLTGNFNSVPMTTSSNMEDISKSDTLELRDFIFIGGGVCIVVLVMSICCCCCCCKRKKRRTKEFSKPNENEFSIQIRLPMHMSEQKANTPNKVHPDNPSPQPINVYCPIIQGQNNRICNERKNIMQTAEMRISNDTGSSLENMIFHQNEYMVPKQIERSNDMSEHKKRCVKDRNFTDNSKQPIYTEIVDQSKPVFSEEQSTENYAKPVKKNKFDKKSRAKRKHETEYAEISDIEPAKSVTEQSTQNYAKTEKKNKFDKKSSAERKHETECAEVADIESAKPVRARRGRYPSTISRFFYPTKLWSIDLK